MMTKEEYKSEIVRMWDSLRGEHKGEYSCYGVDCEFCPLGRRCDRIFSFEMIEAVEKWSNEHPQKNTKFLGSNTIFLIYLLKITAK